MCTDELIDEQMTILDFLMYKLPNASLQKNLPHSGPSLSVSTCGCRAMTDSPYRAGSRKGLGRELGPLPSAAPKDWVR